MRLTLALYNCLVGFFVFGCHGRLLRTHVSTNNTYTGEWLQVMSDSYVQKTSEIDYECVSVNVTSHKNDLIRITKKATVHARENIVWSNDYAPLLKNSEKTSFEDNLILTPVTNDSSLIVPLYFRRTTPSFDYIIWTGLDNKTMYVWIRDFTEAHLWTKDILTSLTELDFYSGYKEPQYSFSSTCFKGNLVSVDGSV